MLSKSRTSLLVAYCLFAAISLLTVTGPSPNNSPVILYAVPLSQDLEIWIGERKHSVSSQIKDNHIYYPLAELASIAGFQWNERGEDLLTVEGPLGTLELVDSRPLVRFEEEYILLSSPAWRKQPKEWYISEDFLTKVLSLVLDRTLTQFSEKRYRMDALAKNQVQVEVRNFPDHVRIIFQPTFDAPIRILEFERYIQVEFSEYRIRPEFPTTLPDSRLVSSVEFDSSNLYGTFRIQKGDSYDSFLESTLSRPTRRIIDVYSAPSMPPMSSLTSSPDMAASHSDQANPSSQPAQVIFENIITIDPGHGGGDHGVNSVAGITEKDLTLKIANLIKMHLQEAGYRTMLTRTRDVELALEQRSSVGNYYRSIIYLSLHIGGTPSPETRGPIVYVHRHQHDTETIKGDHIAPLPPSSGVLHLNGNGKLTHWEKAQEPYVSSSQRLAQQIQSDLNILWGVHNNSQVIPLALLAPISAPALLVETGFLTNPEDQVMLISLDFQEQLATTISQAIIKFVEEPPELD